MVRGALPPVKGSQGGARLVEGTADQVKWEELDFTEPRHSVGVGCFPDQVVSIVQECTDGGDPGPDKRRYTISTVWSYWRQL